MARVLIVDDAAFMRRVLGDVLSKNGHEVRGEAGNGAETVERFQARVLEAIEKAMAA
jgi:two-component system chemotaxis response regulator CheY